jgi:transposase
MLGRRWRGGEGRAIEDLRARVLAAIDGGMAARAAAVFRVSVSYIYKALIRRRRNWRDEREHTTRPPPAQALGRAGSGAGGAAAHPDFTLAAMQSWLLAEHAVWLSNGALWSAVDRLGLSFKKTYGPPRPQEAYAR